MKISAILLCIAVLVSSVSCNSGSSKAPNGMTADEILVNCQNVSNSINTIQWTETITMNTRAGESVMSVLLTFDKANRSYYELVHSSIANTTSVLYVLDNWAYACYSTSTEKWVKAQLPEDSWNKMPNYGPGELEILLGDYSKESYLRLESVGGINCYKIDITPSYDAVIDALNMTMTGTKKIKEFSCTIWIADDTYYPAKLSTNMTITDGSTISVIFTYSDINQPVNLTLPAAAQNATVISYSESVGQLFW